VEEVTGRVKKPIVQTSGELIRGLVDQRMIEINFRNPTFLERMFGVSEKEELEEEKKISLATFAASVAELVTNVRIWGVRWDLHARERFNIQRFVFSGLQYVAGARNGLTPSQGAAIDLALEDMQIESRSRLELLRQEPVDSLKAIKPYSHLDAKSAKGFFNPLAHVALVENFCVFRPKLITDSTGN
jgi:hypothetical protein